MSLAMAIVISASSTLTLTLMILMIVPFGLCLSILGLANVLLNQDILAQVRFLLDLLFGDTLF